jgi:MFS superfamily sulfate permease-like transporter
MKWFLSTLFFFSWALWFGGAVAILIFVQRLFHFDRNIAIVAAPQLFLTFEKYQLVLAAVALAALFARKRLSALLPLILAATVMATLSAVAVTPRINRLRIAGETSSAAFRALHGLSMIIYLVEVVLLLVVGLLLTRPAKKSTEVTEESPRTLELS